MCHVGFIQILLLMHVPTFFLTMLKSSFNKLIALFGSVCQFPVLLHHIFGIEHFFTGMTQKLLIEVVTKCLPLQSSSENLHLPVWKWLDISFNSIWLSLTSFINYHFVSKTLLHIEHGNETSCGSVRFSLILVFNRLGLFPW